MNGEKKIKIKKESVEEELVSEENQENAAVKKELGEEVLASESESDISRNKGVIFEKIAKTCLYILVLLTPLFFIPFTVAPVETNKYFLAIILVLIAFLCYLIRSFQSRAIFYPKSLIGLAVLAILAVAGISVLFSPVREVSIFGNLIQPDAFLGFLIYGLAFFLAAVFLKKEDFSAKLGLYSFVGLVLITLLGLLQIFGKFILPWAFARQASFNPIGSTFSWGVFITFGLVMIVSVLISFKLARNLKIALSLAGLLIMATLIILNYQLLWIGLALAMFLLIIYKFVSRANINVPLVIIVISLFFVLAGRQLPAFVSAPAEVRPDFATTFSVVKGSLTGGRILVGSGPATFGYGYTRFRPAELNQTNFWSMRFNQSFSFLTTILSTLGLLGILAALFLVFSFIRQTFKVLNDEKFLPIIIGISFLTINLFLYPASFVQLLFIFLGLGLLAVDSGKNVEMEFYSPNKLKNIKGLAILAGVIVLFSFSLYLVYSTGQKYFAAIYYAKGLQGSSLAQSITRLEKSVRLNSQSDQYLRALSQARLSQADELTRTPSTQENANEVQGQLQNIISLTISSARKATEINPIESLNWSNLGNIYSNIIPVKDADTFAEDSYNKAIALDPNNPQNFVDLAKSLIVSFDQSQQTNDLLQEKLSKAKAALEKAISLKPDYAPANFLIVQVYIREGDLTKAIAKLEEMKSANLNDAGFAFQLGFFYYKNNQSDWAQGELERAVALSPDYSNARYFLGLIYEQKGLKQEAIEQFERIEQLNPDNQEVKNILINLRANKPALGGIVPPAKPPENRAEVLTP